MNEYKCKHCLHKMSTIINYVNHTNEHKIKYFNKDWKGTNISSILNKNK